MQKIQKLNCRFEKVYEKTDKCLDKQMSSAF